MASIPSHSFSMKKPWRSNTSTGSSARPGGASQHSIRGRISGPIPISTPMDDEFPIRNPGTGIASTTPVGSEFKDSIDESVPLSEDHPHRAPPPPPAPPVLSSPRGDVAQPMNTAPAPRPLTSAPSKLRRLPPRTHASSAMRFSTISADTIHSRGSKDRPHRKKSTLRGAIGKIFHRRRRNGSNHGSPNNTDSEGVPPSESFHQRPATIKETQSPDLRLVERHRPTVRSRPFPGAESKRSASLPITEFDRALRSHSIGPEDVLAIESARNSLTADFGLARRRAAARARESDLAGLSPRPASTHVRDTKMTEGNDDPAEIGRAITSDFTGVRRRSRSLSGLIEVESDQEAPRRRSDEIRYWRESYDPTFKSPVSSEVPEVEKTEETVLIAPEVAAVTEEEVSTHTPEPEPEPYTFSTFVTMGDMSGMKITEAANLEARLGELEGRVKRLEQVLTQLCNAHPDFRPQILVEHPDRPAPSIPDRRPSTAHVVSSVSARQPTINQASFRHLSSSARPSSSRSEASHLSFGEAPTFVDSLHRPGGQPAFAPSNRPTSNATIRGVASLPSLQVEPSGPFTADHYATLMALIHTERSAREVLEAQVKRLGYQVSVMTKASTVTQNTGYDPPPTAKSFGDCSAFDHDDDIEEGSLLRTTERVEAQPEIEDQESATSEYSEPFQTPREEAHSYGAFGEKLDEDDSKRTARTLSLSQLTLGRKPPNSTPPL